MIKTGKSFEDTIQDISDLADSKVSQDRKIAGISMEKDIEANNLLENLFKFSETQHVQGRKTLEFIEEYNKTSLRENELPMVPIFPIEEGYADD